MTKTMRLVGIIASIAILVSALLGTGAFFLINHLNNSKAITSYTSIGNLLKDGNTVNYDVYSVLMDRLGTKTGQVRTLDEGTPIVFTMAGRDWQVVYRDPNNPDIISVWMTNYYTTGQFSTGSAHAYKGATIQTTVTTYFDTQQKTYPILNNITVSPSDMSEIYKEEQDKEYPLSYLNFDTVGSALSKLSDKFWLASLYEAFSLWGLED